MVTITSKPLTTHQSQQDFDNIKALVKPMRVIRITNDSGFGLGDGSDVKQIVFYIENLSFDRLYYIYTPHHGMTQVDGIANEIIITPINSHWLRVDEDWN